MKKVYYYLVFHKSVDVETRYVRCSQDDEWYESGNNVSYNGIEYVNGEDVVNQSHYYNSVEVALKHRYATIEGSRGGYDNELWYYHTVSPVMEGWVNDYEKSYDE